MLEILAGSAAAGFGSSFGRDVYRKIRDGGLAIWGLVGFFLIAFGYHELVRKHRRGLFGTVFLTIIGSIVMIVFGTIVMGILLLVLAPSLVIVTTLAFHVLSAIGGIIWGIVSRRKVEKLEQIEQHNLDFMVYHGLSNSAFDNDVIEDSSGYKLRVKDERDESIIFSVIGSRNARARISIVGGKMIDYTGVVQM